MKGNLHFFARFFPLPFTAQAVLPGFTVVTGGFFLDSVVVLEVVVATDVLVVELVVVLLAVDVVVELLTVEIVVLLLLTVEIVVFVEVVEFVLLLSSVVTLDVAVVMLEGNAVVDV